MFQTRPAQETLPSATLKLPPLPTGLAGVQVRRSARRRKTVAARVEAGQAVVFLPAGLAADEEQAWVNRMVKRLATKQTRAVHSDENLERRASEIASRYLNQAAGRELRPTSVRWVSNMNHRWGSCSVDIGAIRLSDRLQQMPDWVIDYVLAHELAHLKFDGHGPGFKRLLAHYPQSERAAGYLDGWSAAQAIGPTKQA